MSSTLFLFWVGFKHYIGKVNNERLTKTTQEFWRATSTGERYCCFCGKHIAWRDRSIDHIIPKSVCYELELYNLLFDTRNFRLAHGKCNSKRASALDDLPNSVLAKLKNLGYNL